MPKPFDVVALLSSAVMMSRKAESYHPETHVIDLAELRQIIFENAAKEREESRLTTLAPIHSGRSDGSSLLSVALIQPGCHIFRRVIP